MTPEDDAPWNELARRFLDLWQDQAAALLADPRSQASLSRWMDSRGAGGSAGGPSDGPPSDGLTSGKSAVAARSGSGYEEFLQAFHACSQAFGAAAIAAASGGGDRKLDELTARLDDLEERLARLEGRGGGGRAARRSGRGG